MLKNAIRLAKMTTLFLITWICFLRRGTQKPKGIRGKLEIFSFLGGEYFFIYDNEANIVLK
jgi:hypothetical protein